MRRKRNCAFTLIELLVVISIITVLIAMLLPALSSAKYRVKVLYCSALLQQLGVGIAAYVSQNDGNYPLPSVINSNWITSEYTWVDNRPTMNEISGGVPYRCPIP